ncbi:MAG: hypothetical protein L3J81_03300 [Thermoplasmata archaeon]|jgi:hypothetical protein|nr:hypothetical protein [Thermoplasmata archaeon]
MLRWALMIAYIGVLVVALIVQLFYPSVSTLLFYGVLGWFVLSLFLYRLPAMNRPVSFGGGSKPAPAPVVAGSAPLPSGPIDVGFCIHCGTHIAPGISVCPTCGRTVLPV